MQTLATKLAATAAIAALIVATPVSIDLIRPAAGQDGTARLALSLDSAQARPLRLGHEATLGTSEKGYVTARQWRQPGGNAGRLGELRMRLGQREGR